MVIAEPVDPPPTPARADRRSARARHIATHPVVVAAVLTLFTLPLEVQGGLDNSWKVALNLAVARGIPFGSGLVFTYGPLGFLVEPMDLSRRLLFLGLAFAVVATFALLVVVVLWLRTWLRPGTAVVVAIVLALIASRMAAAEMSAAALVLWVLWLLRRESLGTRTPLWAFAALGSVSAMLFLTKIGTGVMGLTVVVLALVAPSRIRRLGTAAGSALLALVVLWVAAGEHLGDLPVWLRRSFEIVSGYSAAMGGTYTAWSYAVLLVPLVVVLAIGLVLSIRRHRDLSWAFVLVVAWAFWLFVKEAFVRFDIYHPPLVLAFAALLIVVFPWRRREIAIGLGGIGFCLVAFVFNVGGGTPDLVGARVTSTKELVRVTRELVDGGYYERRLAAEREALRLPVDPSILAALRDRAVHSDPGDMGIVYSYDLDWHPTPVFLSYAAYTSALDTVNAEALAADDGPTGILYRSGPIDGRNPRWESPDYQVAMVCNFEVAAAAGAWQALHRASDICGEAVPLQRVEAAQGAPVPVPRPTTPGNLVVARFHLETGLVDRAAALLLKPFRNPTVTIDGRPYFFVTGTAGNQHLVHQPATAAGRILPAGPIDDQTLQFDDVGGPVVIEFAEIPLGASSGQ